MRRNVSDAWLAARAYVVAVLVPLLMRLDLRRLPHLLEPRRPPRGRSDAEVDRTASIVQRVVTSRLPFIRRGCLTRGVTLYYFLRRAGADVELAFGVGRPLNDVEGHCWLLKDGVPYLEATDPRPGFTPVFTIRGRALGRAG